MIRQLVFCADYNLFCLVEGIDKQDIEDFVINTQIPKLLGQLVEDESIDFDNDKVQHLDLAFLDYDEDIKDLILESNRTEENCLVRTSKVILETN